MFGISRQTVRQAINILVQKNFLESRQGSGTYVIYSTVPKRESHMMIGVMTTYVESYIFPNTIKGIETVLRHNGYSMQLSLTHNKVENERMVLRGMMDNGVDGIIAEPTKSGLPNPNVAIYEELQRQKLPILFINAYLPNLKIPHVSMDDKIAGMLVTERLIRAGHRKIFGIFKLDDYQGHLRYAGYLEALIKAEIPISGDRVLWYSTEDFAYLTRKMDSILNRLADCSAIVCYNDELAIQVVSQLIKNGISVPDQISVISIDNSDLAKLCEVPLTSAAHPMAELGKIAAANLLNLIEDPHFNATQDIIPAIVERGSVKDIFYNQK
jgi:GntR family transcriptional regulator of arabinose operon